MVTFPLPPDVSKTNAVKVKRSRQDGKVRGFMLSTEWYRALIMNDELTFQLSGEYESMVSYKIHTIACT